MKAPLIVAATMAAVSFAAAESAELNSDGVDHGRRAAATLDAGLSIRTESPDARPSRCFIVARFRDNRPLMRGADGLWEFWNGDTAALADSGCRVDGMDLVFEISGAPLPEMPFPVSFTFGYELNNENRFGFVTVDGP
jgi:hypothetical protein